MEVVLTGGPGGGKSVILSQLAPALQPLKIMTVGEVPTFLALALPNFLDISAKQAEAFDHFQQALLRLEIATKKECRQLGRNLDVDIIVFDRSEIDAEFFWGAEKLRRALQKEGISREEVLSSYDLILHLQSVAVTEPEQLRRADNNPIRSSDPHHAQEAEKKAWETWEKEGAQLIPSQKNLEDKTAAVAKAIKTYYHNHFASQG